MIFLRADWATVGSVLARLVRRASTEPISSLPVAVASTRSDVGSAWPVTSLTSRVCSPGSSLTLMRAGDFGAGWEHGDGVDLGGDGHFASEEAGAAQKERGSCEQPECAHVCLWGVPSSRRGALSAVIVLGLWRLWGESRAAASVPTAARAGERPWVGIWAVDAAWCKFKDKIGVHTPAPIRITAKDIEGMEVRCR